MAPVNTNALLRQRLLNDIRELQEHPYPGIQLHTHDENALESACLVLSPPNQESLHLTIHFGKKYPLEPPTVKIQSAVHHPNVFDHYICASILNTAEGYTTAYTLKGICIQLLSFFSSDTVEQMHGDGTIDRQQWQQDHDREVQRLLASNPRLLYRPGHKCKACGFGQDQEADSRVEGSALEHQGDVQMTDDEPPYAYAKPNARVGIVDLPNEVLLLVCDLLDEKALLLAAKSWNGFGRVMRRYNIIHVREMQCFTLKKGFNEATLGVGIHVRGKEIQSEFDLISKEAFYNLDIGRSVQGLDFEYWLPLPISQKHWAYGAKKHVQESLSRIGQTARTGSSIDTLFSFLNDIVVRLSREASGESVPGRGRISRYLFDDDEIEPKSTLTHASEKAIESYFHLYHLLLCLAIDDPTIVKDANDTITTFMNGKTHKQDVPNLGHLLIKVLISDHEVTEALTKTIIKEAITRNVVWMLDAKGQNMPELAFLETDTVSNYRLQKTFEAGKTSYRLLMFARLMQRCVASTTTTTTTTTTDPATGSTSHKSITDRSHDLFNRHGAPPPGAASSLAAEVRRIQNVKDFPNFLKFMGMEKIPRADEFTKFLKQTLSDSVEKGYSKWAVNQGEALLMRRLKEPNVGVSQGLMAAGLGCRRITFFPEKRDGGAVRIGQGVRGDRGGRGGRGGRGERGGRRY